MEIGELRVKKVVVSIDSIGYQLLIGGFIGVLAIGIVTRCCKYILSRTYGTLFIIGLSSKIALLAQSNIDRDKLIKALLKALGFRSTQHKITTLQCLLT